MKRSVERNKFYYLDTFIVTHRFDILRNKCPEVKVSTYVEIVIWSIDLRYTSIKNPTS